MSVQSDSKQRLTNLSAFKVINILISLAIMICFKFIPVSEPLTPLGIEVIGIFLGMLYGWLIANDSFWPSIFGLILLGLSSYSTVPDVLKSGFGNSTVLLIFSFMLLLILLVQQVLLNILRAGLLAEKLFKANLMY